MSERRANPYIGPRPFEPGEKLYGRERETRELMDLLIAERIVLLHSPSGAGKTSLLQAAIVPRLRQRRFNVLPIMRVNRQVPTASANRYVYSALSFLEDGQPAAERLDEPALASLTLNEYQRQRGSRFGSADSQVLVFDQFEEVLSVDPTDRAAKEAFFAQLGEALLERRRWALIAIREDYMGGLAPYVRAVPTQLSNTFRLDLLDPPAARQAIQRPAHDTGVEFTDKAAEKLVDDLRVVQMQQPDGSMAPQLGPYIEPVQLQVVCLRLWDRLRPEATEIVETDVSAVGDVDAALAGYYAERVGAIARETGVSERAMREWFDRQLITEQGIRSQVLQERDRSRGLKNAAIQSFIKAHIVRAEERPGRTWYELAHDRLIAPLRANNAEWFAAHLSALQKQADLWQTHERQAGFLLSGKALVDAEGWAKEHAAELTEVERDFLRECRDARARAEREQKQNRLIRWLALGAGLLSLAAVVGFLIAFSLYGRASVAEQQASHEAASARNAQAAAVAEADRANEQARIAIAERNRAEEQSRVSNSLRLAALSTSHRHTDFDLSLLLGLEATRLDKSAQVQGNLLDALLSKPRLSSHLHGHTFRVVSVAFSPDGKTLASSSCGHFSTGEVCDGAEIILWDVASRQPIGAPLKGHKSAARGVAFSPDGKMLASSSCGHFTTTGACDRGEIILWDVASRQPIGAPLMGHTNSVGKVIFSPDGKTLATAGDDRTILLWDVASRQPIGAPLTGHTGSVLGIAFSPDGKTLASGSVDKTILLWDIASRQPIGAPLKGHTNIVYSVAFSPDGKTLASGSVDQTILLWDVASRQPLGAPLTGHTDVVLSVAFSPDGKTLASGSTDSTIRLWDVASRQPIEAPLTGHRDAVFSVAYSPDGKMLASGSFDKTVGLWDMSNRQPLATPLKGHTHYVRSVAFSPDGKTLAAGSRDTTISLWDISASLNTSIASRQPVSQSLQGHTGDVWSVTFSPDGKTLASGSYDKTVRLWDVASRQPIGAPLLGHAYSVLSVVFSPDGKTLASGSYDSTIRLWDVASRQPIGAPLQGHTAEVVSVAFSPDGKTLVSGSWDKTVRWWDVTRRQAIGAPLQGHMDEVLDVAYSPDGKTVASSSCGHFSTTGACDSGEIILWDAASRQPIGAPLEGHTDGILTVAFSPDSKTLASAGDDRSIILWDVASRQPLAAPLTGHTDAVYSVAFSPDGKTLASGGEDTTILLWDLDLESWKTRACHIVNRNLTRAEWAQYIDPDPSTFRATCPGLPLEPKP